MRVQIAGARGEGLLDKARLQLLGLSRYGRRLEPNISLARVATVPKLALIRLNRTMLCTRVKCGLNHAQYSQYVFHPVGVLVQHFEGPLQ